MASSSSSTTTLLLAGSAIVVAAATAMQFFPSSSPSSSTALSTELVDDDTEYITADEVTKIFNRLFLEMQQVIAQLSQQVQQIQMAGQMIPEAQLRKLLKAEFERALVQRQTTVCKEFDLDEDCLEEATWEFLGQPEKYPEVKKSVERFQKLYENISGESVVGKRPGGVEETKEEVPPEKILPPEKVIQAAEAYFGSLTNAMKDIVEPYKADGKNLRDMKVAQEIQMKFATVANDKGEEALEKLGVTSAQFQASIEKNAENPVVARTLAMLQMKQQQDMMAMGLPA